MTRLKPGCDDMLLAQTQQHKFANIYAMDVCKCLTNRNLYKTLRKSRFKQKDTKHTTQSCSLNSKPITTTSNAPAHPAFHWRPTVSWALYRNALQQLVGTLVWHITASTAISILATLYYFIVHTQGASAVLDVTATRTSLPATATILSMSSTASSSYTLQQTAKTTATTTTTPLPSTPTPLPIISQGHRHSISTFNNLNISISNNNNSSDDATNILLDLNYNIKSTEIAISNGISSFATTKASGNRTDNNNNQNSSQSNGSGSGNNWNDSNYNNVITVSYNNAIGINVSMDELPDEDASEYIFDRLDIRILFITLYSMVFCCCFFGNLLVILVVTLSRRLRSITNFFLANLALADFCVGLFCVMQNLSIYLIDSWVFGEFLCRMYQFVHSLSYTASIFILVVICTERYFAIVHPITCKQILTAARLKIVILAVWMMSAVYSTPKFIFSKTIKNVHTESGREEEICVLDRKMFNSKLLDMINFGLLYIIPLFVMTILYSKIAVALWRSSCGLQHHFAQQENGMGMHNSMYQHHHQHPHHHHHHHHPQSHNHNHNNLQQHQHQQQQPTSQQQQMSAALSTPSSLVSVSKLSRKQSSKYDAKRGVNISESQESSYKVSLDDDRPVVSTCRKTSFYQHSHNHLTHQQQQQQQTQPAAPGHHLRTHNQQHQHQGLHGSQRIPQISHSSNNVLRARRGVVRMLIIFVLTFALCNLPYHARKMWQYWSRSYRGDSNFNALLTPLTFLVTYFNSGINPLLYAFLSRNFRKGMRELLMCSWRKSKTKSSTNSSMHHKRATMQTHSFPTDITHIGNDQL